MSVKIGQYASLIPMVADRYLSVQKVVILAPKVSKSGEKCCFSLFWPLFAYVFLLNSMRN